MRNTFIIIFMAMMLVGSVYADDSVTSVSLVNQDPDPVIAGDLVEIRLGMENSGEDDAVNQVLEIMEEYPFTVIGSATEEVGTIHAYQTDTNINIVKFKLKIDSDAAAGTYDLEVRSYSADSPDEHKSKIITIDVKGEDSAEIIHIDKTILSPGQETQMTFTIRNVGNAPLKDLTFEWENEDELVLPVGGDNKKFIKSIDVGESVEVEYNVIGDSNVEAGLYKLDLLLTYEDSISGATTKTTSIAGVYIGGGTDFDVSYQASSGSDVSFTIANIGGNPATSVSIMVPNQDGWSVSGANSVIVGNLEQGDYTVASFALSQEASGNKTAGAGMDGSTQTPVQKDPSEMTQEERQAMRANRMASGEMPNGAGGGFSESGSVKLRIAYTDTMGVRKDITKLVPVNAGISASSSSDRAAGMQMTNQEGFLDQYMWQLIGLGVLVVIWIGYSKFKKSKLKRFKK